MSARKFDNVELNQTITFLENGMIETGAVCKVDKNTFTLRVLRCWDNNGMMTYYDAHFSFYKTGTKSHSHYTHGNAIEITGNL